MSRSPVVGRRYESVPEHARTRRLRLRRYAWSAERCTADRDTARAPVTARSTPYAPRGALAADRSVARTRSMQASGRSGGRVSSAPWLRSCGTADSYSRRGRTHGDSGAEYHARPACFRVRAQPPRRAADAHGQVEPLNCTTRRARRESMSCTPSERRHSTQCTSAHADTAVTLSASRLVMYKKTLTLSRAKQRAALHRTHEFSASGPTGRIRHVSQAHARLLAPLANCSKRTNSEIDPLLLPYSCRRCQTDASGARQIDRLTDASRRSGTPSPSWQNAAWDGGSRPIWPPSARHAR